MEIIKSSHNQKVKYYKSLLLKKNRIKNAQYLIEGFHLCQMAKEAGVLQEIILKKDTKFNFDSKIYVTQEIIKSLSTTTTPQPILGIANLSYKKTLISNKNTLVVDNIQDPGNLGSLLRSALAFDFKNIVLSLKTVDLYNPKTLRSSQGAIFKLNILRQDLTKFLNSFNGEIISTSLLNKSIDESVLKSLTDPKCLIVGNEASGIRKEILHFATNNFVIDIKNIDSLNVVVAASILMEKLK